MELNSTVLLVEDRIHKVSDHLKFLQVKMEDYVFRAQRLVTAIKAGIPIKDKGFGEDMLILRKELITFGADVIDLPNMIGRLEMDARYEADELKRFQQVNMVQVVHRETMGLQKEMQNLSGTAGLLHQHARQTPFVQESMYIGIEIEKMVERTDRLPMRVHKAVLALSNPDEEQPRTPEAPSKISPPSQ